MSSQNKRIRFDDSDYGSTAETNERAALLEIGRANESSSSLEPEDVYPKAAKLRRVAIDLSLYINLAITVSKLVAYIQTLSLSVLAALVDSVLDVVSQMVLNYTERHSSLQRSSAFYPAGASRLEPIGVLTCAALMGMASFEVIKESLENLFITKSGFEDASWAALWAMIIIVVVKLFLLVLCQKAAGDPFNERTGKQSVKRSHPTLEALAQDHWNDALSNSVAAVALVCAMASPNLWFLDPVGAILISIYIIFSWYITGKEQIEHLTGKAAPDEFIEELREIASTFDERMTVDVCRAYHFGARFLVELEVVMERETLLFESHDLGMDLQYEIEGREEVERCFVHIDYETRPYDEHVVSKVPELREKLQVDLARSHSCHSV